MPVEGLVNLYSFMLGCPRFAELDCLQNRSGVHRALAMFMAYREHTGPLTIDIVCWYKGDFHL